MAKTKEELNQLKKEFEALNNKLKKLTEDELKQVVGGANVDEQKRNITYFNKGDCFINSNYPDEPYYVPYNQSAPAGKYDFVYLDAYSKSRREWSSSPIMYYLFDLDDGIYVYHPELNNLNYK